MTDIEKQLANALKRIVYSADHYIEDGSWIEILDMDIKNAKKVIAKYKDIKKSKPDLTDHYMAEQERPMFYGD